jgi:glycosyltransferase involved in cell wall biosynthesis
MRIVHVIHTPRLSGAEVLVGNLALAQIAAGHDVSVVALAPLQDDYKEKWDRLLGAGVKAVAPLRRMTPMGRLRWCTQVACLRLACVVYAHTIIPSAYVRLTKQLTCSGYRVCSVLHSATQDDYDQNLWFWIELLIMPQPNFVVTVVPRAAENFYKRFGKNTAIHVIPNCSDLASAAFSPAARASTREMLLGAENEDAEIFLHIARIAPYKNQAVSIAAARAYAVQNRRRVVLLLCGLEEDRRYFESLEQAITTQTTEFFQVQFLGSRRDVNRLLSASDLFLLPSSTELISLALLEALASGITIVASNIEAFRFSRRYAGVVLTEINEFSQRIATMSPAKLRNRYSRDLRDFAPDEISKRYLKALDESEQLEVL